MEISARKPEGLAEMEAGVSSQNGVVSSPFCAAGMNVNYMYHQKSVSSPISGRFRVSKLDATHYLDSCTLCKKPLMKKDIYMYRGDIPFCSEECREEEMEREEEKEKKKKMMMKAMRQSSSSASPSPTRYAFDTATFAAA